MENEKEIIKTIEIEEMENNFIKKYLLILNLSARLSFIGHSLGGIIIRAALPHLAHYKDIMTTFMTFSTPHLGTFRGGSMIVNNGIRIMKFFGKGLALK